MKFGRLGRLACVTGVLALGSCERTTDAPRLDADLIGWAADALLTCRPLPYDSTTVTIGPDGGSLSVGPHTFTVPAGALTSPTAITAVVDADSVNQIRFTPQGLEFLEPASLTMSYANCGLLRRFIPKRIAYTTDDFRILEIIPSVDNFLSRTVTGQVSHFSDYAIAW